MASVAVVGRFVRRWSWRVGDGVGIGSGDAVRKGGCVGDAVRVGEGEGGTASKRYVTKNGSVQESCHTDAHANTRTHATHPRDYKRQQQI